MVESVALGPITMMFFASGERGSIPLFFKSTICSRPILRARSRCFFELTTLIGIDVHETSESGSKSPSSKRPFRSRLTLTSISDSLMSPRFTAPGRFLYTPPHSTSVPLSTPRADAALASFDTSWRPSR